MNWLHTSWKCAWFIQRLIYETFTDKEPDKNGVCDRYIPGMSIASRRETRRDNGITLKKLSSVAVWSKFRLKMVVALAMDIRDICKYEILAENGRTNTVLCLDFLGD